MEQTFQIIIGNKVYNTVRVSRVEVIQTILRNPKAQLTYHEAARVTAMKKARQNQLVGLGTAFNVEAAW